MTPIDTSAYAICCAMLTYLLIFRPALVQIIGPPMCPVLRHRSSLSNVYGLDQGSKRLTAKETGLETPRIRLLPASE